MPNLQVRTRAWCAKLVRHENNCCGDSSETPSQNHQSELRIAGLGESSRRVKRCFLWSSDDWNSIHAKLKKAAVRMQEQELG